MSTINATLRRVHLQSPQPKALAEFYGRAYGLRVSEHGAAYLCRADGREVGVSGGAAGRLRYALFAFAQAGDWKAFQNHTSKLSRVDAVGFPELPAGALCFPDPEGNHIAFMLDESSSAASASGRLAGFTQHFALRTRQMAEMIRFYSEALGFTISDNVRDDTGEVRACFLRTDELHHALALFKAPVASFDHQAFEAPDWEGLKNWADHMADEKIEIAWGVGRHGPGNDTFFMIRDLDQNLVEISAELEVCPPTRPAGEWKHEERTLNLWGKAILRS
jgi:catechol-2,3-dioxygenase